VAELGVIETLLPGVTLLQCPHYTDNRGDFTKVFHSSALHAQGLSFSPAESFLTRSKACVIRGMHFQIGEAAHDKLVYCPRGRVLDVVVDIRPESENFNMPVAVELSESTNQALLITKGYAHGFLSIDEDSWMLYHTSTVHCPRLDRSVLWSSIDFQWPTSTALVSDRDKLHPPIQTLA